jgi:hypothetical protein
MIKKIFSIITIVYLCFAFNALYLEAETYVSGTYQQGHNATEPRPQKSKFLKTYTGGFAVSERGARYALLIDVITKRSKDYIIKAEYEDPSNKKPIIQEGRLPHKDKSISLGTDYIKGLKIKKDYTVKVYLIDTDTLQTVDTLIQKVRSYIDTTGDKVIILKGLENKKIQNGK